MAIHGTVVAADGLGVLLRGAPGAGKSDLAIRLIAAGAMLVADDQVILEPRGEQLWASAPPPIAGLIEVRGVGLMRQRFVAWARLALVVDLVAPGAVERLPEPETVMLDGVAVPLLRLAPFEASAPVKILIALRRAPSAAGYDAVDTGEKWIVGYKEGA